MRVTSHVSRFTLHGSRGRYHEYGVGYKYLGSVVLAVIHAKAGIQRWFRTLDPRLRGDDKHRIRLII